MTPKKQSKNKTIEVRKELLSRLKKNKPSFRRANYKHYRFARDSWRRPRGIHNKLKKYEGGKGHMPSVGYGTPSIIKGLHPSGYEEVMIYAPKKIEDVDSETQAVRIGSSVGKKKKEDIVKKADKMGIKVLNR